MFSVSVCRVWWKWTSSVTMLPAGFYVCIKLIWCCSQTIVEYPTPLDQPSVVYGGCALSHWGERSVMTVSTYPSLWSPSGHSNWKSWLWMRCESTCERVAILIWKDLGRQLQGWCWLAKMFAHSSCCMYIYIQCRLCMDYHTIVKVSDKLCYWALLCTDVNGLHSIRYNYYCRHVASLSNSAHERRW